MRSRKLPGAFIDGWDPFVAYEFLLPFQLPAPENGNRLAINRRDKISLFRSRPPFQEGDRYTETGTSSVVTFLQMCETSQPLFNCLLKGFARERPCPFVRNPDTRMKVKGGTNERHSSRERCKISLLRPSCDRPEPNVRYILN